MSYLLLNRKGNRPSGRSGGGGSGGGRRNPSISSAHRARPGASSWRNPRPSGQQRGLGNAAGGNHAGGSGLHGQQRGAHGGVVSGGGGQLQLQRAAPPQQQQRQQQGPAPGQQVSQQEMQQGMVSMDEVYADLQILEQQRQESERKVASAQLARKQKLEQKSALDRRLCELKSQNGGMRAELHRAANQLALKHRELLEAQGRSEEGRKRLNKFDARLKRAVGVARLLPGYKARVEHLVRQLNEKEARLNFAKGQVLSKLQSAMVRRDDARHRHELLVKAINANAVKERSIAEDITRIRSEIASNEQDLSAAQQMESQTKLRVETIEHEVSMERTRHADAVSDLESKAKEIDDAKDATARAIEEKKAAIEAKKQQLSEMFAKCNELRKAEGHDTFPEPKWGEEQPPSLDVARVRVRVAAEEKALEGKKAERDALRKDVTDLDATIASNAAKAAEKRAEAEALMKEAAAAREVEAQRKADMEKMVAEADVECAEVEKLRASIGELTATKEAHAEEVKSKLEGEQGTVSAMDTEIATTLEEIAVVEKAKSEHEEKEGAEKQAIVAEIAKAKSLADIVKGAYEQAQKKADNFAALPDDELAMELKQLDEEEKQIIEEADRERDEMIEQEPVLEHVKLDWNSDIPIEEQKEVGITYIRQHCDDFLETAKAERQVRVEHARATFFEEKAREETAEAEAEVNRLAAEKRRKKGAADERRRKKEAAEEKRRKKEATRLAEKAKLKKAKEEEEEKARLRREARKQKEIEEKAAADSKRKKEEERAAKRKAEEKARRRKEEERRIEEELEEEKRLEELPYNERKSHQLEDMRMRSQKMHELLKSEEESINKERKEKDDRRSRKESERRSRKEAEQQKKLKDDAKKRDEANKRRSSKSGGERERSKSRSRSSKPDGREKRSTDGAKEQKSKRSRSSDAAPSKRTSSSGRAKSVLKSKDNKRPRTSSTSVRFQETASRPKLDIFSSTVHKKEKRGKKKSSSKLSQTSTGESSCEQGGRRRKRPSAGAGKKKGSKSKAKALQVTDMADDGGGFHF